MTFNTSTQASRFEEWRRLLYQRGISDEVITLFQIQPRADGWVYPVPGDSKALRYKNFNSSTRGPKYKWLPRKPKGVLYFHAPDFIQAIELASGTVWIASGEPDVWAMHSAGIPNVFCWLDGEASVPVSLATDLAAWGVNEVHMAPDRDKTGTESAVRVRARLEGSGIHFIPHQLPEQLGEKGDVGKAWQQYSSEQLFEDWLLSLPRLALPENTQPLMQVQAEAGAADASGKGATSLPPEFTTAVETELGVQRYRSNGWSTFVRCPFHDDRNPSAQWHREMHILHCHACGQTWKAKEVGAQLGIYLREYYPAPADRSLVSAASPPPPTPDDTGPETVVAPECVEDVSESSEAVPPEDLHEFLGLPMELRTTILQRGQDALARILDTLYYAGWEGGDTFTAQEAIEACQTVGIGKNTVRSVLQTRVVLVSADETEQEGEGDGVTDEQNYSLLFDTISRKEESMESTDVKSTGKNQRGRPTTIYRLPTISELCAIYGVSMAQMTEYHLPSKAMSDSRSYRIAMHRAYTDLYPGPANRDEQAERLGVSRQTVYKYDRPAGLIVTERTQRRRLTHADLDQYTDNYQDRPGNEWIEDAHGYQRRPTRAGLLSALETGKAYCVYRIANDYQVGEEYPLLKGVLQVVWPEEVVSSSKVYDVTIVVGSAQK